MAASIRSGIESGARVMDRVSGVTAILSATLFHLGCRAEDPSLAAALLSLTGEYFTEKARQSLLHSLTA
jgi:hypothetical protein